MSHLLWKYYLEDNVDKFRSLLANGLTASPYAPKSYTGGVGQSGNMGTVAGSPGTGFGTSPRATMKNRKSSGLGYGGSGAKGQIITIGRTELNVRDQSGLTILHRAVSAVGANAVSFALALIEHPAVDIYIQDSENGWTALHRALYFGNVTLARTLLERDAKDSIGQRPNNAVSRPNALIKIKDYEGNSPFDVYNATIARRALEHRSKAEAVPGYEEEDDDSVGAGSKENETTIYGSIDADEIFAFGSNKNLTLGFGDEDDRQHPEKINLKRPDHLLFRFHQEYLLSKSPAEDTPRDMLQAPISSISDLPALVRNRPIIIQDVALSKLQSAILTTDPESNLYMCGFGPGGRLGTGDENTRFNYVCIEGGGLVGKKVVAVALGQNHSMAVSSEGEIFTWGTNTWGQLGYSLPRPVLQDEQPVNPLPRQIFGPLKREIIVGVAASAIHSIAFTSNSLYTWGKNEGQLGLMDSDSRSLEAQTVPRRVAASLFTSPIQMVSAIHRATVCLLANHTVYVFTNYGYNNVKFPMHDGFTNYHLNSIALTTRYEIEPSHISSVTSGGDTIAAISSRGDLFTLNVSQKLDSGPAATSTTNPTKIRNALSPPQRVWSLRKGNWDGVKSVGVAENGTVILCTHAGAVWCRTRRAKINDTYMMGAGRSKNKDYKFQRVPGLTKVAAVRSNVFGAYAALRKDCDVTRTQIIVQEQQLWKDLAPLFILKDFQPTEPQGDGEVVSRFWRPALTKEHFGLLQRAVLMSPDLEADVSQHVKKVPVGHEKYNVDVCSSLSETSIPVHSFILAARSPTLRDALIAYRKGGISSNNDSFIITCEGILKIMFYGLDFLTILNLVLYIYTDRVFDVWHFTKHAPKSAYRYRQVRTELMRIASKLGLTRLESAVRLMSTPESRLHIDLAAALQDPRFFEDGDTIVELDGAEVKIHSALIRQRCPFFEGLFNGRAAGRWLTGRRGFEDGAVRIDMKHVGPSTFNFILHYLYADIGIELFDELVSTNVDEFCDVVMDVMSVADELMLDRLSQICQQIIGRFVNTRNICNLLNAVAPCAVTEFKNAGLEYLCLQLETMLENHLLDDLDEELMVELDEIVRGNQLACLPFAKSDRAEILLHERHSSLVGEIDEERQRKVRDMTFRIAMRDDENRLSSSFRAKVGSIDDNLSSSPSQEKLRRKSKNRNAPFSPAIRPKDSTADLMFNMDDEEPTLLGNAASPKQRPIDWAEDPRSRPLTPITPRTTWQVAKRKETLKIDGSPVSNPKTPSVISKTLSPQDTAEVVNDNDSPPVSSAPWSSGMLPSSKLDMRDIMAQASRGRASSLSISLSAEKAKIDVAVKSLAPKISQRERKKQQQQQLLLQALQQVTETPQLIVDKPFSDNKPSTPWQLPSSGHRISLKDVLEPEGEDSPSTLKPSASPLPALAPSPRRTASPDTRFAGQRRSGSSTTVSKASTTTPLALGRDISRPSIHLQGSKSVPLTPYSKSYTNPIARAEPSLQLSMADIIGQQKREQDLIKEAVAKRSLQEIQEEQAFQEWWDQESKRAQEEEALRTKGGSANAVGGHTRGKGGKRGRGGGQRGRGDTGRNHRKGRGRGDGSGQEHGHGAMFG